MITRYRQEFNQRYTDAAYVGVLSDMEQWSGSPIQFRIAETPCFVSEGLLHQVADMGAELTHQLLGNSSYLQQSLQVIPDRFRLPRDTPHPHFMTADFGFVRNAAGTLLPKLVELQAFPSVFAFQALLAEAYCQRYRLDSGLKSFLNGHSSTSFWELFRRTVVGGHDPAEVVLAEIEPYQQKTLPDFLITSQRLGIATVDVTRLIVHREQGRPQLFYKKASGVQRVRRIYNRVIVDELMQKNIELPFDYREDLDLEWAGHPNWYFRISKYSIPFLKHPAVPEAVFLDEWLAGAGSAHLHQERESILLKPLFSFAGKGIVFAPSDQELAAIPRAEQRGYLIQEKVDFTPTIETPYGPTQTEIRILYLWPNGGSMEPVLSLARLGRGKMMGVDHNRNQKWVGASTCYYPGT